MGHSFNRCSRCSSSLIYSICYFFDMKTLLIEKSRCHVNAHSKMKAFDLLKATKSSTMACYFHYHSYLSIFLTYLHKMFLNWWWNSCEVIKYAVRNRIIWTLTFWMYSQRAAIRVLSTTIWCTSPPIKEYHTSSGNLRHPFTTSIPNLAIASTWIHFINTLAKPPQNNAKKLQAL